MAFDKKEYFKQYRALNREKLNQRHREWYAANKERCSAVKAAYASTHKEEIAVYKKEWSKSPVGIASQKKRSYFYFYPNATPENYQHYLDCTNCDICGVEFEEGMGINKKNQDHCHVTGNIRGVVCNKCNRLIGQVEKNKLKNVDLISSCMDYLSRYK